MSTNNGVQTANLTQTVNSLNDALSKSAALRAQAVQFLAQRQRAESAALAIEQSRIVSRFGNNSVESREIAALVLANTARGNTVALETQRSQVAVPQSTPNGFIVYGLVIDSTAAPRKGIDIVATSNDYATLASTKTDSQGAFLIVVPTTPPVKEQGAPGSAPPKDTPSKTAGHKAGSAPAKDTAGTSPAAVDKAAAPPAPLTFQLALSDKAKTPTFRNPEVFQAKGGQIAYREVVMPAKPAAPAGKSG
jgi:hypothetical protein